MTKFFAWVFWTLVRWFNFGFACVFLTVAVWMTALMLGIGVIGGFMGAQIFQMPNPQAVVPMMLVLFFIGASFTLITQGVIVIWLRPSFHGFREEANRVEKVTANAGA